MLLVLVVISLLVWIGYLVFCLIKKIRCKRAVDRLANIPNLFWMGVVDELPNASSQSIPEGTYIFYRGANVLCKKTHGKWVAQKSSSSSGGGNDSSDDDGLMLATTLLNLNTCINAATI